MLRLRTTRCCTRSITYSVRASASLGMSREGETGCCAAGLASITTGLPKPTCRKNFAAAPRERLRRRSWPTAPPARRLRSSFLETAASPRLDLPSQLSDQERGPRRNREADLTRKAELSEQASPSAALTRC